MGALQRLIRNVFGENSKQEFRELFALAWPAILTSFAKFFNFTISIIMCGHLSRIELDAVALANTTLNIFGLCIALGLTTAMDTIFSRTFGRGEQHKMLTLLIKFWILTGCTFLVLATIHIQSESILLLLQQNALVAKLSSFYIAYYLPGLFFDFSFLTFARYLQNQNIVYPPMIFAFCGNIFNAVSQYIAIYVLNYDYLSSAICQALSSSVMFFSQLIYIICANVNKNSDFSLKEALSEWGIFFKLGIPGILMVGLEEWSFEIATLAAGIIGVVQLGVQTIMLQIGAMCFMIPLGISIAVNIRVGQHLGANAPTKAKNCFRIGLALVFCTATFVCTLVSSLSSELPKIFTDDIEVIEGCAQVMGILGFFQYGDGFSAIPCGAMRGCGRQLLGAALVFIGYYVISTPIGFVLAFALGLEVKGMWIGLAIGISLEAIATILIVCNTDWNKYAQIASQKSTVPSDSILEVTENSETAPLIKKNIPRRHLSYSSRCSSIDSQKILEELLANEKKSDHRSTKYLVMCRSFCLFLLVCIFCVSLIIRLIRPEICIPFSAIDNSTDLDRVPFIVMCNESLGQ